MRARERLFLHLWERREKHLCCPCYEAEEVALRQSPQGPPDLHCVRNHIGGALPCVSARTGKVPKIFSPAFPDPCTVRPADSLHGYRASPHAAVISSYPLAPACNAPDVRMHN